MIVEEIMITDLFLLKANKVKEALHLIKDRKISHILILDKRHSVKFKFSTIKDLSNASVYIDKIATAMVKNRSSILTEANFPGVTR